jgi:hypothetical protein
MIILLSASHYDDYDGRNTANNLEQRELRNLDFIFVVGMGSEHEATARE